MEDKKVFALKNHDGIVIYARHIGKPTKQEILAKFGEVFFGFYQKIEYAMSYNDLLENKNVFIDIIYTNIKSNKKE